MMDVVGANPRIAAIVAEVEEDLTQYRQALRARGRPASATDVATEITRAAGVAITPRAARLRLDKLVTGGEARVGLATTGRRRFLYEPLLLEEPSA